MLDKIKTATEAMFTVYNPYQNGIYGTDLVFAAKTMREVREALEHDKDFATDVARRQFQAVMYETRRIAEIMRGREGGNEPC